MTFTATITDLAADSAPLRESFGHASVEDAHAAAVQHIHTAQPGRPGQGRWGRRVRGVEPRGERRVAAARGHTDHRRCGELRPSPRSAGRNGCSGAGLRVEPTELRSRRQRAHLDRLPTGWRLENLTPAKVNPRC